MLQNTVFFSTGHHQIEISFYLVSKLQNNETRKFNDELWIQTFFI